jgi:hypothetical protein
MKMEITYKGNIFTYTLHDCREEGNGEKGYIAFVDLFKGCVTSTQNNNFRELEKMVRSAIKNWLEPTSLTVAERQRLEQLERLVASKDYFYTAMAESVDSSIGFKQFFTEAVESRGFIGDSTELSRAFMVGIQYLLKNPNPTKEITPELMEERFNAWYSEQLKSDIAFLNNPYYECNEAWHASYQYALKSQVEGQ